MEKKIPAPKKTKPKAPTKPKAAAAKKAPARKPTKKIPAAAKPKKAAAAKKPAKTLPRVKQQRKAAKAKPVAPMLQLALKSLDDDQAVEISTIDLAGKTSIADYMVVASGRSQRQVGAMAMHLMERLKKAGYRGVTVEGMPQNDWVLVDAGDVIVHLFRPEVRTFYNLEKMWSAELADAAHG